MSAGGENDGGSGDLCLSRARWDDGLAERKFSYHTLWPEALVVYPQGLPTAGKLTDPRGESPAGNLRRATMAIAT